MVLIERIKDLIARCIKQFNAFDRRRRILILLLIGTVIVSGLFNIVYKPQRDTAYRMRRESESLNRKVDDMRSKIPDMKREERLISEEKRSLRILQEELSSLEAQLPRQSGLPQLLGELVAQASGYSIDFISIKPLPAKKKKEYAHMDIEMKFNAAYSDLTNYLRRLENVSQFLAVSDVTMEKMKDKPSETTLILSTILGEAGRKPPLSEQEAVAAVEPIALKRDPFVSQEVKEIEKETKQAYRLSGTVSRGRRSTAIIDGNVYRIGDVIENKTIKKILPNMVVLGNGKESIVLTIKKD